MEKHLVASTLDRVIDRAIQVHGALGYSTDTPLAEMAKQVRWARFTDCTEELHLRRIAQRTIDAWQKEGSVSSAAGSLPL
jgi:acyl-CoA dehydrogenase